jgi:hypothetical protein
MFECSPAFSLHRLAANEDEAIARNLLFAFDVGPTLESPYTVALDIAANGLDMLFTVCEVGNCGLGHDYLTADARVALFRSGDGGETWTREHSVNGWGTYRFASDGGVLYVENTPPDGPDPPRDPDALTGNDREGTGRWETAIYRVPSMALLVRASADGSYPYGVAADDALVRIDDSGRRLVHQDGSAYFALDDPRLQIRNFFYFGSSDVLQLELSDLTSESPRLLFAVVSGEQVQDVFELSAMAGPFRLVGWLDPRTAFGELFPDNGSPMPAILSLDTATLRPIDAGFSYTDADHWTFDPPTGRKRLVGLQLPPAPTD